VAADVSQALSKCPSDTYIIISQPGVVAADFSNGLSTPNLKHYLNKTDAWVVPEVAGVLDAASIEKEVEERCKADVLRIDATSMLPQYMRNGIDTDTRTAGTIPNDGVYPRVVFVRFPTLPTTHSHRAAKLEEHDSFLHAVLSQVGGSSYTVLYTTSPPTSPLASTEEDYTMDDPLQSILHTDMKRDFNSHVMKSNTSDLALFDKYEFLSPGVFMGIFISLILFMILYVGISAVASVEVSYFAFSKEMGPSGQKKQ
jgi:hypothetical protein